MKRVNNHLFVYSAHEYSKAKKKKKVRRLIGKANVYVIITQIIEINIPK